MRTIRILDLIITILFYSMLGIGTIFFVIYTFFLFGIDLGIKTTTTFSSKNDDLLYLILFFNFIFYSTYTYSIFLFKQNITSFLNFNFFTDRVIINFKTMGIIYILGNIINSLIIPFFKQHIKIDFGFDNNLLNFPLNGLIIGLFFLVMSKVFQIAKNQKKENIELKQENELTI
ncbi:DUF2975 domain-containing protein [Paenimyroides tangerinum]|uniref:DUF2975 domain-containing protein n=2 Tax=Paenimyroides tangerinum TaxID=2488728 RepID=A0A3P3WAN5_9FLAO|nr:DUF2975 domain-containing protein [Paenimyroides tangerinum]